jgi:hypothetical protein
MLRFNDYNVQDNAEFDEHYDDNKWIQQKIQEGNIKVEKKTEIIHAKNEKDAMKKAKYFCNIKKRRQDGEDGPEVQPWFFKNEFISLKPEQPKENVDLLRAKMHSVGDQKDIPNYTLWRCLPI